MSSVRQQGAIRDRKHGGSAAWLLVLAYSLFSRLYVILRFSGNRLDDDGITLYWYTRGVLEQGTVFPASGAYLGGFGYQAVSAWVVSLTGLDLRDIYLYIYPLVGAGVILIAYGFFSWILPKRSLALLATLLLSFQADLLFTTTRGSHELFTQPLVILCLWFLCYLALDRSGSRVLVFYAALLGLITYNLLFAGTVVSILMMVVLSGAFFLARSRLGARLSVLFYTLTASLVLLFIVVFYAYPPAANYVAPLQDLWTKVTALSLSFGAEVSSTPYQYIGQVWDSSLIWLLLSATSLAVLAISGLYLGFLAWKAWLKREEAVDQKTQLLAIIVAVGMFFGVASIISDLSGASIGGLQVRLLPVVYQPAAALAVLAIDRFSTSHSIAERIPRRVRLAALYSVFGVMAFLPLLKATNEPAINAYWLFHSESEELSVPWVREHVPHERLWTGPRGRYAWVLNFYGPEPLERSNVDTDLIEPGTRYVALSRLIEMQSVKAGLPLPVVGHASLLYDNGDVRVYRLPETSTGDAAK